MPSSRSCCNGCRLATHRIKKSVFCKMNIKRKSCFKTTHNVTWVTLNFWSVCDSLCSWVSQSLIRDKRRFASFKHWQTETTKDSLYDTWVIETASRWCVSASFPSYPDFPPGLFSNIKFYVAVLLLLIFWKKATKKQHMPLRNSSGIWLLSNGFMW